MENLVQLLRGPTAKIITRVIIYGLAVVLGKLGVDAAQIEGPAAAIGDAAAAIILVVLGAIIDRWHHKQDTKK